MNYVKKNNLQYLEDCNFFFQLTQDIIETNIFVSSHNIFFLICVSTQFSHYYMVVVLRV